MNQVHFLAPENHVFWQNNEAIKCWTNKGMAESIEKYKTIQTSRETNGCFVACCLQCVTLWGAPPPNNF
jgi:hypothetical protein